MFPFTPHTTLRLNFGLGGSLFLGVLKHSIGDVRNVPQVPPVEKSWSPVIHKGPLTTLSQSVAGNA
jgi:hypothetical protein